MPMLVLQVIVGDTFDFPALGIIKGIVFSGPEMIIDLCLGTGIVFGWNACEHF